jgi:hypothetical protein
VALHERSIAVILIGFVVHVLEKVFVRRKVIIAVFPSGANKERFRGICGWMKLRLGSISKRVAPKHDKEQYNDTRKLAFVKNMGRVPKMITNGLSWEAVGR